MPPKTIPSTSGTNGANITDDVSDDAANDLDFDLEDSKDAEGAISRIPSIASLAYDGNSLVRWLGRLERSDI